MGAPQAVQVADRWHVLHNLSETLTLLFTRHRAEIQKASRALAPAPASAETSPAPAPEDAAEATTAPLVPVVLGHAYRAPKMQALQDARRAQRLACYEQVVTLRNQHVTPAEIAERLGISSRTVHRWLAQDGIPLARQRRRRASLLDSYEPYVLCRWQAGCHNGAQLWREVVAQGYTGSARSFYHFLARLPAPPPKPKPSRPRRVKPPPGPYDHLTTKQAVWLVVRPQAELTQTEQETCSFLHQVHPHLEAAYHLAQDFVALFAERDADRLDRWIKRARKSHIPELVRFGSGLMQDYEAVRASLVLPYSQGVVEGHVNRLKLIKRMMYGRASFPLLRQRILQSA